MEEFLEILYLEGDVFGETKYDLTDNALFENLNRHSDIFQKAKGVCICLSKDLMSFKDVWRGIYSLLQYENIEIYFIKTNPNLCSEKNLNSYQLLLTGLNSGNKNRIKGK